METLLSFVIPTGAKRSGGTLLEMFFDGALRSKPSGAKTN